MCAVLRQEERAVDTLRDWHTVPCFARSCVAEPQFPTFRKHVGVGDLYARRSPPMPGPPLRAAETCSSRRRMARGRRSRRRDRRDRRRCPARRCRSCRRVERIARRRRDSACRCRSSDTSRRSRAHRSTRARRGARALRLRWETRGRSRWLRRCGAGSAWVRSRGRRPTPPRRTRAPGRSTRSRRRNRDRARAFRIPAGALRSALR
jgi:hypothetical protein